MFTPCWDTALFYAVWLHSSTSEESPGWKPATLDENTSAAWTQKTINAYKNEWNANSSFTVLSGHICLAAPSCRLVPGHAGLSFWAIPSAAPHWRSPSGGTRRPAPTSVWPVRSVYALGRALSVSLLPLLQFLGPSATDNGVLFAETSTAWMRINHVRTDQCLFIQLNNV